MLQLTDTLDKHCSANLRNIVIYGFVDATNKAFELHFSLFIQAFGELLKLITPYKMHKNAPSRHNFQRTPNIYAPQVQYTKRILIKLLTWNSKWKYMAKII